MADSPSSFFRAVAPRPFDDDDYPSLETPAWMGPPWGAAPTLVSIDTELGRSDDTVVSLQTLRVYGEGVVLRLSVRCRETGRMARQRLFGTLERAHGRGALDERFDPSGLRWGVRFADGRSVTTLDDSPWATSGADVTDAAIDGPVLEGLGRPSVFMDEWTRDFWLWPTPPAPAFEVGVEWLARGIAETVTSIDARAAAVASERAQPAWP